MRARPQFTSPTLQAMNTPENEQLRDDMNRLFAAKVDQALADVLQLDLEPAMFAASLSTGLATIVLAQAAAMTEVGKRDGANMTPKQMINTIMAGLHGSLMNLLAEAEKEARDGRPG